MNPLATAILGIVSGVLALGFVLVAFAIGFDIDKTIEHGVILGGMASMGVGAYGALKTPTKSDAPKG